MSASKTPITDTEKFIFPGSNYDIGCTEFVVYADVAARLEIENSTLREKIKEIESLSFNDF